MSLLADYAITPDVFDVTSYSNDEVCAARLETIREAMLTEGIVRDLHGGRWRTLFRAGIRPWHRRGKELVSKLATQGRLVRFQLALPAAPVDDQGWCAEALATHARHPLTGGTIVTKPVKDAYPSERLVARIDRLNSASWWAARGPSVTLTRTLADYQKHLNPILRCSNSILFIDPHLDPERRGYHDFGVLLKQAGARTPAPEIEIHRVCYQGSGSARIFPMEDDNTYFKRRFDNKLGQLMQNSGLRLKVFIWDDFHDRFLISNLVGISLPNGFDTGGAHPETRWTRLSRNDRDGIQREFDPVSRKHELRAEFSIP